MIVGLPCGLLIESGVACDNPNLLPHFQGAGLARTACQGFNSSPKYAALRITRMQHHRNRQPCLRAREAEALNQEDEQRLCSLYGLETRVLFLREEWSTALEVLRKQAVVLRSREELFSLGENYGRPATALGHLQNFRDASIALDQQSALGASSSSMNVWRTRTGIGDR